MTLLVQKYGGTSVGTVERIHRVAGRVARARADGHDVVVIVSAMSGETNRLLSLGRDVAKNPSKRELDVLVATGEQVSVALLAIALEAQGVPARSLLAHQVGIKTDGVHSFARIQKIERGAIDAVLEAGQVAIVAGFQGTGPSGEITTLGRGGSDTSAVAVAAALEADVCEIYTDVRGVFTADPNVCSDARKVPRITYEEMLELASLGAKVLQIRSVELAMKFNVPLHVRSSFHEEEGTMVVSEEAGLESVVVASVTADRNETKVTIENVPDEPGIVATIFEPIAAANICVDMIIQNVSKDGSTDLTFTVTRDNIEEATEVAEAVCKQIGADGVIVDDDVVKVSIVGLGMRTHAGVAAKMFRLLAEERINVEAITTSEIKVSCLIRSKYAELAVRTLHDGFELSKQPS